MTDVKIGVQFTHYAVEEDDGSVSLCAQIVEGCLERYVVIKYATFDATAQSTYVLYQSSLLLVYCTHTFYIVMYIYNCSTYSSQGFLPCYYHREDNKPKYVIHADASYYNIILHYSMLDFLPRR